MPTHTLKTKNGKFHVVGKKPQFRVGDKVKVRLGNAYSKAQIVEDRGPIGVKGRRLMRVQLLHAKSEPESTFEVPVDDLAHS